MKPVTPAAIPVGAALVVLGANQPKYEPLPAAVSPDGSVMTEWELSAEDLSTLLNGGRLRMWTWTFGNPFQPVALEVVAVCGRSLMVEPHPTRRGEWRITGNASRLNCRPQARRS